ncbi:superoxide dismutase [Epilithonimonas sp.]|uniref:superoxide dismutase n=1 Tax=Epilithonimonas sp. TaxID=2894511 RepID=UPI0028A07B63|nr:superoxide dismutase [Epilithonimonas sp.]
MKIKKIFLASAISAATFAAAQFKQTALPYAYNALEGSVDAQTMEIHYTKHAAAYVANLNKAIAGTPLEKESLEKILSHISKESPAVRNNAGGHYNHELFWTVLTPEKNTQPSAKLSKAINDSFGSLDALKEKLSKAGADRFGSGWAWLVVTADKKLAVTSTGNQDNPLMDLAEVKGTPIFGIDVWEHAYYLKYQNKRADYLAALWNVTNWKEISRRYEEAIK